LNTLQPDLEFIDLLSNVGKDFSLAQGLGGNCSVKSNGEMLVKASGKRLADAASPGYFYEVEISDGEYRETTKVQDGKPSIEVFLHALLPHKYVIHLHSTKGVAVAMLSAHSESIRDETLNRGIIMINYARPGIALKDAIKSEINISSCEAPDTTFLMKNHGTLFGASSVDELGEVVARFEQWATSKIGTGLQVALTPNNLTAVLDEAAIDHIQWHARVNWRLSPDHVVFLGATAPQELLGNLRAPMTVLDFLRTVLSDVGKIGPREEQLLWFVNVVQFLPRLSFPTLSEIEANDLCSWEAERHRVKAAANERENRSR
jgi:rhamnose utilization protein RhaD (predicted bifunctional aldolase and dehydrogenase)